MDVLATGLFLAAVNTKLVDWIAAPIRQRYPELDLWWMLYVALLTGALISWLAGVNLFAGLVENDLLGRILSALLVGGGASLIHDIFDDKPEPPAVVMVGDVERIEYGGEYE
jgi:hypothetical protein